MIQLLTDTCLWTVWPGPSIGSAKFAEQMNCPLWIIPGFQLDQMNSSGLGAARKYLAKSLPFFSSASVQLTDASRRYMRVKLSSLPTFNSP